MKFINKRAFIITSGTDSSVYVLTTITVRSQEPVGLRMGVVLQYGAVSASDQPFGPEQSTGVGTRPVGGDANALRHPVIQGIIF